MASALQFKLDKQTRRVLRDNAELVLKRKGLTLDDYIDQKCLELVALTPMLPLKQDNTSPHYPKN